MQRRVAVHVDPRLLSEALLTELSRRSIRVTPLHLPGNDAAVVSNPEGVAASVVIEMLDREQVWVRTDDSIEERRCRSVDELLALIDEFAS